MAKKRMKKLDWLAITLLIVGGLNWGLVGAFNWNLVEALLGSFPVVVRFVYGLVGLASLYSVYTLYKLK